MNEEDLDRAADLVMETPCWNPRPLIRDEIHDLLKAAWNGEVRGSSG